MTKKEIKKKRREKLLKKKKNIARNNLAKKGSTHLSFEQRKRNMNERVNLYTRESTEDDYIMEPRVVSLEELKELNVENEYLGFNRGLDWEVFEKAMIEGFKKMGQWVDSDTNTVILQPRMYHQHAQGKETNLHMRCSIFTNEILSSNLCIDLPIERVKSLRVICSSVYGEVA